MKKETILYPVFIFILSIILGCVWSVSATMPFPEGFERTNEEYIDFIKNHHYIVLSNPMNHLESQDFFSDWLEEEIYSRHIACLSLGGVLAITVGVIRYKRDRKAFVGTD